MNTKDTDELRDELWNLEIGVIAKKDGERIVKYLDTNTQNTLVELFNSHQQQAIERAVIAELNKYVYGADARVIQQRIAHLTQENKERE